MRRSSRGLAVALAIVGNAVLIILSLLWLQILDAKIWQVAISFFLAVFVVVAFLWLQTYTLRAFAEERTARFAVGMLMFACLMVVGYFLLLPVGALEARAAGISYFWNSQLPRGMRYWLPQPRILHLLRVVVAALRFWIVPGLLLPLAAAGAAYRDERVGMRAAGRALLRGRYWLLLGVDFVIAFVVARDLVAWSPGHTPRQQVVSLVARMVVVYLVGVAAWLIAVRVACVRVGRGCRNAKAGGENVRGNA